MDLRPNPEIGYPQLNPWLPRFAERVVVLFEFGPEISKPPDQPPAKYNRHMTLLLPAVFVVQIVDQGHGWHQPAQKFPHDGIHAIK